jgi:hypothetical protein
VPIFARSAVVHPLALIVASRVGLDKIDPPGAAVRRNKCATSPGIGPQSARLHSARDQLTETDGHTRMRDIS